MATIVNPDQLGKSIRSKNQARILAADTAERVAPKLQKRSTNRLIALLPKMRTDSRDHYARRVQRQTTLKIIVQILQDRGIMVTEQMYGTSVPNGQYRGEYHPVPKY